MADTFKRNACHTLEWNTELAYNGMDRQSPIFLVRGIEHYFCFSRSDEYNSRLRLKVTDEAYGSRFRSFSVTVHVQVKTGGSFSTIREPSNVTFDLDGRYLSFQYSFYADQGLLDVQIVRFFFIFASSDQLKLLEDKASDKSVQTSSVIGSRSCLEYLSGDFSKLLAADADHDVVLKCGGRVIQAHKTVLRARSSVFAAMLKCDMVEGRTGCVQIQDMDEDTFQAFVSYLYSGTLPELHWGSAVKLYAVGDKYAVVGLKKRCAIFLAESLTPENACECLALADAHHDAELKECVIPYVLDNGVPLLGDQWVPFVREHPALAAEVLGRFYQLQKQA